MTSVPPSDPIVALNEVLSEVIDVVLAVRQAHHRVPEGHELHAELDRLSGDIRSWADLLATADSALGVSALDYMPSTTARRPPRLWPGPVSDDEVRQVIGEQLDRLAEHVRAAMSRQDDDRTREVLHRVSEDLQPHLDAFKKP